jgi:Zn-dependent protease with chaperone function
VISQHAIPVAYANPQAKLDLIQQWPAQVKEIRQSLADGSHTNRRWSDVQDIGFREIESGQKDDIKTGQEAIRDLKRSGLMPMEVEDPVVVNYVRNLAQKLAAKSDLQVPLQITVLNSKEVNAFALPGGFVFIDRGLLESAEDESQVAGVIAHEMSHGVGRHGHKPMVKATIASIIYQAAQVAAVIFTGGAAGIGTYYALQYGFYGLGLTLNLTLLGVSRDFEQQADQLGIQYAWNAGYDPTGFVRFFDKMATKEGYVNGARTGEITQTYSSLGPATWNEINTYDAVYGMLDKMGRLPGRRILVVIGSCIDTFSQHSMDDVKRKIEEENLTVFAAGLGSMLGGVADPFMSSSGQLLLMQAQAFLQMLASKSGGFAWFPKMSNAFNDVTEGIMQSIATQYRIVYDTKIKGAGKFKKIKVEAFRVVNDKRENFKVLVREGWR